MQIVEQLEQVVRSRRQEQQSRTVLGVMDRDRILLHYRNTSQAPVSPAGRGEMFAFCFSLLSTLMLLTVTPTQHLCRHCRHF